MIGRRSLLAAAGAALAPGIATAQTAPLDLAQYRGKVVYLDFWASWCGPCKLSFPFMSRLRSSRQKDGLVIVAVNLDHERARADAFLSHQDSAIPVVFDPKGEIATQFHVKDMPTSLIIDRGGRTRYVHEGFLQAKTPQYEAHVTELLNER